MWGISLPPFKTSHGLNAARSALGVRRQAAYRFFRNRSATGNGRGARGKAVLLRRLQKPGVRRQKRRHVELTTDKVGLRARRVRYTCLLDVERVFALDMRQSSDVGQAGGVCALSKLWQRVRKPTLCVVPVGVSLSRPKAAGRRICPQHQCSGATGRVDHASGKRERFSKPYPACFLSSSWFQLSKLMDAFRMFPASFSGATSFGSGRSVLAIISGRRVKLRTQGKWRSAVGVMASLGRTLGYLAWSLVSCPSRGHLPPVVCVFQPPDGQSVYNQGIAARDQRRGHNLRDDVRHGFPTRSWLWGRRNLRTQMPMSSRAKRRRD